MAGIRDTRPIIPRNQSNLWSKGEQIRDEIYGQLAEICRGAGIEPRLLQSSAFMFPAWINFEAWDPQADPTTTRRSSATITIDPKPCHKHEFEFEIALATAGKALTLKRVKHPTAEELRQLVNFLLNGGTRPTFRQFRERPQQFWRERNKVQGLSVDWLSIGVSLFGIAGFLTITTQPIGIFLWIVAGIFVYLLRRRGHLTRNDGKPDDEPRALTRVDSWQTVLFDLGNQVAMVRDRFTHAMRDGLGPQCRFRPERLWYWGLEGKEEREQLVLTGGRGIVFCQIYQYGQDLYVGWDGHLNRGQWVEQTVASGIDRATGSPISISRVVPGTQPTSEYDLADLSCLMEWTHAQVVKLLRQLIAEYKIDQEIDFKIQRSSRQHLVASGESSAPTGVAGRVRKAFQRTA